MGFELEFVCYDRLSTLNIAVSDLTPSKMILWLGRVSVHDCDALFRDNHCHEREGCRVLMLSLMPS